MQGIHRQEGTFHTRQMVEYGHVCSAASLPARVERKTIGIPVFNTVRGCRPGCRRQGFRIYYPPTFAADAIMEAADALFPRVFITEGIPVLDMVKCAPFFWWDNADALVGSELPRRDLAGK